MDFKYLVIMITAPSLEVADEIAFRLVERKLAACVNTVVPISSIYAWEGKVTRDEEVLLVVKARAEGFEERFVPAVQELHPYEVPEIIALPIVMGLGSYLSWMDEVTTE